MKKLSATSLRGEKSTPSPLDATDLRILELLRDNSRLQWKKIGQEVHLTGQAVAARIRRLEDLGVIKGYSIRINQEMLARPLAAFLTVSMKSSDHAAFERFVRGKDEIVEAHRISGGGCYLLRAELGGTEALDRLREEILAYGNYDLCISIGRIK